jgi:hypothetical protein
MIELAAGDDEAKLASGMSAIDACSNIRKFFNFIFAFFSLPPKTTHRGS